MDSIVLEGLFGYREGECLVYCGIVCFELVLGGIGLYLDVFVVFCGFLLGVFSGFLDEVVEYGMVWCGWVGVGRVGRNWFRFGILAFYFFLCKYIVSFVFLVSIVSGLWNRGG